ncbi:PREDICTED: unconventional prefoldin RPB5 interactor [Dufourea novaeangliae]|uniref:unconventional prefoldin RPB5 interactor n=1 Tax=Dufourea novaeangliae TaxID=178035 RepID=UPI000767D1FA|nr:PREDICTED: unconventional prefoldin RPB5 interactor [Dufourea novaeangliae]
MNPEGEARNFQRVLLDEVFSKAIQRNEQQCKIWTDYKKGHEKVAQALHTFQKNVYVNCMVPVGKRALLKGKLIHTNEVLACLGDGYFVKYSAEGAAALCARRIQHAEEMLKKLGTERDLYETRMLFANSNLFENCAGKEIVEHWNNDQIEEWKVKHREKEREYHQKLAKFKQEEKKKIETEEDLFERLDQLELEEELADEFNRLKDEQYELFGDEPEDYSYDSESSSESEKDSFNEDKKEEEKEEVMDTQSVEEVESRKIKKSVSFVEPGNTVNKQKVEESTEIKQTNEEIEDSEESIIRIEFRHSECNPVRMSEEDSIKTPADIYRIFSKPKSILKRSSNDIPPIQAPPPDYSTEEDEEEEESIKPSTYETVVKDIKERDTSSEIQNVSNKDKETRPVSRFKRDRQLKK